MRAQRPWLLLGLILGLGAMVAVACGGGDEGITKAELEAALAAGHPHRDRRPGRRNGLRLHRRAR